MIARIAVLIIGLAGIVPAASADWVDFVDHTAARLVSAPGVGADDDQEKDYAWGDVDQDGDIDLVVARKQPWTSAGKAANVLLLNESGILVDRTAEFASDSDVDGDAGFLTPTNDRDIALADLDGDGWLDVVTSPTISFGDPKHVGHPRVYINRGCAGSCEGTSDWLGFRHEDQRIPQLLTWSGTDGVNPCFGSVSVGDVTGDGFADLYFTDQDSGGIVELGTCGSRANDFNDKLLVNHGASNPGFFVDVTDNRFAGDVPDIGLGFEVSYFGAAGAIADINGDSLEDIVKQSAMNLPTYVGVAYNTATSEGFFDTYDVVNQLHPYWVSVGDLNNDARNDLVITDDGADRYMLNQGNGVDGAADWVPFLFSFVHSGAGGSAWDAGFGGNSLVTDLDNDGWNDVLIVDVSDDIPGCSRRLNIYRNLGGPPGGDVILQEQTSGSGCQNFQGNPASCIVAGIPSNQLEGVHDVAVFDLDGDGWKDMILGRCGGTQVYLNTPSSSPVGEVPDGRFIEGTPLTVALDGTNDVVLSWDDSCANPGDYEIYEGQIGAWYSHARRFCSTGGATIQTITPVDGDRYFLVVPTDGTIEGSYGRNSSGAQRPVGSSTCRPARAGHCGS